MVEKMGVAAFLIRDDDDDDDDHDGEGVSNLPYFDPNLRNVFFFASQGTTRPRGQRRTRRSNDRSCDTYGPT